MFPTGPNESSVDKKLFVFNARSSQNQDQNEEEETDKPTMSGSIRQNKRKSNFHLLICCISFGDEKSIKTTRITKQIHLPLMHARTDTGTKIKKKKLCDPPCLGLFGKVEGKAIFIY